MKHVTLTALTVASIVLSCGTNLQAQPHGTNRKIATITANVHVTTTHSGISTRSITCHPRGFCDWNRCCWFAQYNCCGYYCAADQLWFYWYAPHARFYPISFMTIYPPTGLAGAPGLPFTGAPGILPTGIAPGGPGSLPPGATLLPTTQPVTTPPLSTPANPVTPVDPATPVDPMPAPVQ